VSKRANDSVLSELHVCLAEQMLKRLISGEASAAEMNAIRQFLKDNEITAEIAPGTVIGALKEELSEDDHSYLKLVGGQANVG